MTKTTRYLDAQGRVILPLHIRKELNLTKGKVVEVSLEGDTIMIRPTELRCALCGAPIVRQNRMTIHDKPVCAVCCKMIETGDYDIPGVDE